MKKILSVVLSVAVLMSAFAFSFNAFADYTFNREAAEVLELDDGMTVTVVATGDNDDDRERYYFQFSPQETGWYEFSTNKKFRSKATANYDVPYLLVTVCDKKEKLVANVAAHDLSKCKADEVKQYNEDYGYSADLIKMCVEMKAGNTYYFEMSNNGGTDFTTEFLATKHTHKPYKKRIKSIVYQEGDSDEGGIYERCSVPYCDYKKPLELYPLITSITLSKSTYIYDGRAKKPDIIVKLNNGKQLSKSYYTVTYKNNKKVGKASAKIVFKDRYENNNDEPIVRTFKILPPKTKIKKFVVTGNSATVYWKKKSAQTSGYQLQVATNKSFTKNAKTYTVKGSKAKSKTIRGLKKGKKYYFRVRTFKNVGKKKFVSSWSAISSKKAKK